MLGGEPMSAGMCGV